jgi:hypothetical protein
MKDATIAHLRTLNWFFTHGKVASGSLMMPQKTNMAPEDTTVANTDYDSGKTFAKKIP